VRIGPSTTLTQLAFIVGGCLHKAGVSAVLTGGGAATVYAPDAYQSRDLDFVLNFWSSIGSSPECIHQLGFRRSGNSYVHDFTPFTLDFPPGPLSIGDEVITSWSTLEEDGAVLNVITPTDCVRDRLSWFLFYQRFDLAALDQALAVASRQEIDLNRVRAWAIEEGAFERYTIFEARLNTL
jgi:hypothetical protein